MTIKLVEEFIYEASGSKDTASDALRDVFGSSDVTALLTDVQKEKASLNKEIFGDVKLKKNTPEDTAVEQALAVSQKQGGISVGNKIIPHDELVKMLTDPKFRQILASMRSMKDTAIRTPRSTEIRKLPVVRR